VWGPGQVWQVHARSATAYIDMPVVTSNGTPMGGHDQDGRIDNQDTIKESVCIDPDGTAYDHIPAFDTIFPNPLQEGLVECLDEQDWVLRYESTFWRRINLLSNNRNY